MDNADVNGVAVDDRIPVCRNCHRLIRPDRVGIWRHFNGFMLCEPNEDDPLFTGTECAEPSDG